MTKGRAESPELAPLRDEIRHLHVRIDALEDAVKQLQQEVRRVYEEEVFDRAQ